MLRNFGAVVLGLVGGMAVNMVVIHFNSTVFFPAPEGMDMNDVEAYNQYIGSLPYYAFFPVIFAHLAQSFIGAWIAARLAHSRPRALAMVIGVLSLLGGVLAMMMIDGPDWLVIELPFYLLAAWIAGSREVERRQELSTIPLENQG